MMTDTTARRATITATGDALAIARFECGRLLTADEKFWLTHTSRFGSDSYPTRKVGRKWSLESSISKNSPLFATKTEAVVAWETKIATLVRLAGLEAFAAATERQS